ILDDLQSQASYDRLIFSPIQISFIKETENGIRFKHHLLENFLKDSAILLQGRRVYLKVSLIIFMRLDIFPEPFLDLYLHLIKISPVSDDCRFILGSGFEILQDFIFSKIKFANRSKQGILGKSNFSFVLAPHMVAKSDQQLNGP